jgi:hypothetical protein
MNTPDRHPVVITHTRLLAMISAVSNLHARLCELNDLRERVRKAQLWAPRSRRIPRKKITLN